MGARVFEGSFGEEARFDDAPFSDGVFDEGDVAGGDRKVPDAKADEKGDDRGVGGAFAAEDHRFPGRVGGGDDHPDEPENARMSGAIEV